MGGLRSQMRVDPEILHSFLFKSPFHEFDEFQDGPWISVEKSTLARGKDLLRCQKQKSLAATTIISADRTTTTHLTQTHRPTKHKEAGHLHELASTKQ